MDKETASPKQTSGSGFAYEDKVVACFFVWMLAGTNPFSKVGKLERVDCQVGADGWEKFDDVLLSINVGAEIHRRACSIKSNLQYTKNAAPADMVASAWSLYLHKTSKLFDRDKDKIGLISIPHPDPPKIAIHSLLRKAEHQTPEQLDGRISKSGYASSVDPMCQ